MSVAVIITTHGQAANALRESAEMIIGAQDNLATLTFLPGENADTLAEKMLETAQTLDTSQGLILLVDLWGGSPFNAANRVVQTLKDASPAVKAGVVTGVNVPMLAEMLMAREDTDVLDELLQTAVENGREGVRVLGLEIPIKTAAADASAAADAPNHPPAETAASQPSAETVDENDPAVIQARAEASKAITNTQLPVIALLRIDDRLIHGQVATRWSKERNVQRIVVVNDEIARDEMRVTMLKQAVPPGISAHVVGLDKLVRVFNNPEYENERFLLLFTNPSDIENLAARGLPVTSVNIGGMAFREGKTQLSGAVSVNAEDVEAFQALHARGIELEVRKVASDSKVDLMALIQDKYHSAS